MSAQSIIDSHDKALPIAAGSSDDLGKFEKEDLRAAILNQVRADLASLIRTQQDASETATHSENRAEHAKDTRATEQSYLARGLAERVDVMRQTEARLAQLALQAFGGNDPIGLTAVARIRDQETHERQSWWLVPVGGGLDVSRGSEAVRTLTPSSLPGRALMGLTAGAEATVRTPRGDRSFIVVDVL